MNMPSFGATNKPNGLGAAPPVAHAQDLLLTERPQGSSRLQGSSVIEQQLPDIFCCGGIGDGFFSSYRLAI